MVRARAIDERVGRDGWYVPWRLCRDRRRNRRPVPSRARCRTASLGTRRRRTSRRPEDRLAVRRPARPATERTRRSRQRRCTSSHQRPRRRGTSRRNANACRWCAATSTGIRRSPIRRGRSPPPKRPPSAVCQVSTGRRPPLRLDNLRSWTSERFFSFNSLRLN